MEILEIGSENLAFGDDQIILGGKGGEERFQNARGNSFDFVSVDGEFSGFFGEEDGEAGDGGRFVNRPYGNNWGRNDDCEELTVKSFACFCQAVSIETQG